MDELPIDAGARAERTEIDRCGACGGIFLEFFDGEPAAISRGLRSRGDVPTGQTDAREDARPCQCPDCGTEMVLRRYLGQGPALPRCESCLGLFLTPALREEMARFTAAPEEESHEEPGWVRRLIALLGPR